MRRLRLSRCRNSSSQDLTYQVFEPRMLLACDFSFGANHSGVAVADDASGTGYLMYSNEDVHERFSAIGSESADHFVAVRLDGIQWQFNDDVAWVDFEPADKDLLVAELNFSTDQTAVGQGIGIVEGIPRYSLNGNLWIAANRFGGVADVGEFELLGECTDVDLGTLVLPGVESGSRNKLEQLAYGAQAFESSTREFPNLAIYDDAGSPLLSWRVQILPYLGLEDLYNQFNLDEPWDSAHNLALLDQMPEAFKSNNFESTSKTVFQAMGGEETIFPLVSESIGHSQIGDGLSNTVLFVEANANRAVEWTRPKDLTFNEANPLSGLGQISEDGFAVVMASGETHLIPSTISQNNFANLLKRNDDSVVDFTEFAEFRPVDDSIRQITLAALNYENAFRRLPAHAIYSDAGEPLLSWRVAILPFMEQNNLYDQFHLDEPWDSPHNIMLLPLMPHVFAYEGVPNGMTNLIGASGPDSIFDLSDRGIGFGAITDGTTNTIFVVEANADQAVEWSKPSDLLVDAANPLSGLGAIGGDGFHVGFLDGSTVRLPNDVDAANLANMLRRADGGLVDVEREHSLTTNLRQIALAQHNYESSHKRFPHQATYSRFDPDGPPLLSWRVEILPFLEQGNLYQMFNHDEPWDSPHNLALLPFMPDFYSTPGIGDGMTVIQAAIGTNTMFTGAKDNINFGKISDDASNTILVMETNPAQAIEWTRPMDVDFDAASPRDGLVDDEGVGFYAAMADGSVKFINQNVSDMEVGYLLERNDGNSFETNFLVESPTLIERNTTVGSQLRQLSLAAHNFESANNRFPGHAIYTERPGRGGDPLLSWRVSILPFIGQQDLYNQFNLNEPWDSPNNLALIPYMPQEYAHSLTENGMTVFQAVTTVRGSGPTSIFTIGNEETVGFGAITDGSSNTMLFAEANIDQAVIWTKPDDLMYDEADPTAGLTEAFLGFGFNLALADGSTRFVSDCISPEEMRRLILRDDGEFGSGNYDRYCNNGTVTPSDFFGTTGDDVVDVFVGVDSVTLTINGDEQTLDRAQFDQLSFDGLGGNDILAIVDDMGDNVATFSPHSVHVTGDFEILIEDVDDKVVTSGGGNDIAFFSDSDGDDTFSSTDRYAKLTGAGYWSQANRYSDITVNATIGIDIADLEDSAGLDQVIGNEIAQTLTLADGVIQLTGFDSVEFNSVNGGNDSAILDDTSGDDRLTGRPEALNFATGSTSLQLNGFKLPTINAVNGGLDSAVLEDSAFSDSLTGFPGESMLAFNTGVLRVNGFDEFTVNSTNGGGDTAVLEDSTGDDVLTGGPGAWKLTSADGFVQVNNFDDVNFTAENGGFDTVTIMDTSGDDIYEINLNEILINGRARINTAGFEKLTLDSTSGSDQVVFTDSIGDDLFRADGISAELKLYPSGNANSPDQVVTANRFAIVEFKPAVGDGTDRVNFFDTSGDDEFMSAVGLTEFSGAGYYISTTVPEHIVVSSVDGNDVAWISDSLEDDSFSVAPGQATVNRGFQTIEAVGFVTVNVVSEVGGQDDVTLTGTPNKEAFFFDPMTSQLIGIRDEFTAIGFARVSFVGAGGEDQADLIGSLEGDQVEMYADTGVFELMTPNVLVSLTGFGQINADLDTGEDSVTVNGSSLDDDIGFEPGFVSVSGVQTTFENTETFNAIGGAGQDTVRFVDSFDDDTLEIGVGTASMQSASQSFTADGFETVFAVSENGGLDIATLTGATGSDQLMANAERSILSGAGFLFDVSFFPFVNAVGGGGVDTANLSHDIGDVVLDVSGDFASMTTDVTVVSVEGFAIISVDTSGGINEANYTGTDVDEVFVAGPDNARVTGDGFNTSWSGFQRTRATGGGGNDLANLSDSDGHDVYTGTANTGNWNLERGEINVVDFETVSVRSINGGEDLAYLNGSSGNDIYNGNSTVSLLSGAGFLQRVIGFKFVAANAGSGNDKAYFGDSHGSDTFTASSTFGRMNFDESTIRANGFDLYSAVSRNGGIDQAIMNDSPGSDSFFANSAFSRLTGSNFAINASGFGRVMAKATEGDDTAAIIDSEATDNFFARPGFASMTMPDLKISLAGFGDVSGFSQNGGDDTASLLDTTGSDSLFAGEASTSLVGDGYRASAAGFSRVTAFATGGADEAHLFGSDQDDRLFLSPQNGYMRGENFFNATKGFESIFAYAGEGDDKAVLNDSSGDDAFVGTPTSGVLSGDGFRNAALGFDSVSALSSGGNDKASLIDSEGTESPFDPPGNDSFYATPTEAYLRGVGFVNFVRGFAEVSAFASTGFDRVIFHDSAGDDKLNVGRNSIVLVGNGYKIQGFGFHTTIAYASSGNDTASLTDASGDDELYVTNRRTQIIGSVGSHEAIGFDRVFANSVNGGNDLLFGSTRDYELFINGDWRRP